MSRKRAHARFSVIYFFIERVPKLKNLCNERVASLCIIYFLSARAPLGPVCVVVAVSEYIRILNLLSTSSSLSFTLTPLQLGLLVLLLETPLSI